MIFARWPDLSPLPPHRSAKALNQLEDDRRCPCLMLAKNRSLLLSLRHYTPDKWKSSAVWTTPGDRCDPGVPLYKMLH